MGCRAIVPRMLPPRLVDRVHPFRPRLLDALQGYNRQRFLVDLGAGITVGIVALPLALAFAIASGVKPEQGLITAVVAGFLIISINRRMSICWQKSGLSLRLLAYLITMAHPFPGRLPPIGLQLLNCCRWIPVRHDSAAQVKERWYFCHLLMWPWSQSASRVLPTANQQQSVA